MNQEIKAWWISALLSGEYEQGEGLLRDADNKFCCLGVLCDLYSKDTGVEWTKGWGGAIEMHAHTGMTPSQVDQWAGFTATTEYSSEEYDGVYSTLAGLAEMNDSGKTFEQIAEVIEQKL